VAQDPQTEQRCAASRVTFSVRVGWEARALLASGLCLAALVVAESAASAAVLSRPLRAERH